MDGMLSRRRFLQLAGGSVAATMLSDSIARALAIPANRVTGSIRDVEHIVVLMQENRSFDNYFGIMRGVRGSHEMFNGGNWDKWLPSKTPATMAHMVRKDLPFHYALADAFTVCDANFCSMLGPTDPNRYYMWTGWDGNDGKNGGPVIANDELGYG